MVNYTAEDFVIESFGSTYYPDHTVFRVFAPYYDKLDLLMNNNRYPLFKKGFCFENTVYGNCEFARYHFEGEGFSFKDPFAYASDEYGSIVLDPAKFNKEKIIPKTVSKAKIIYECSIRDFSADPSYPGKYKKTFRALSESDLKKDGEPLGLDYLEYLGITHLQLMPIMDYDNDKTDYNWGYNPIAYNHVKKDYLYEQDDPYAFVNELREVINVLHKRNIRVTFDVVFNHVYDRKKNDLGKMLKGHLYRYKEDGTLANGTLVGNEVKSEDPFIRAYIVEMVKRYLHLFDVDGIRMDLMGISDLETVNLIMKTLRKEKADFQVYGEGWNMGDVLPEKDRASILNADRMPDVMMFNDFFRETIIHYISGNNTIVNNVKNALAADPSYLDMHHTLNYVECHDNYTMYDRMMLYKSDEEKWLSLLRCKLALSLILIARGASFIHAGEEFLRTKYGLRDSYNASDEINALDWNLRTRHKELCSYLKDLIRIRKENSDFDDKDAAVDFSEYYECLIYNIGNLKIIINPSTNDYIYDDETEYDVLLSDRGAIEYRSKIITISALSIVICKV